MKKRIIICGDAMVGKSSLLEALAKHNNVFSTREEYKRVNCDGFTLWSVAYLVKASVKQNSNEISLLTTCGVLFDPEDVINYILSKADSVMYVFSTTVSGPNQESQEERFLLHKKIAKDINKLWPNIPWFFVVNKIDWGNIFDVPKEVLENFPKDIIYTSAVTGVGIDKLWNKIINV